MEYKHSKAFYKQVVQTSHFARTSQIHLCNVELPREELHIYMYGPEPESFHVMIELYKSLNILIHTFREIDGAMSIYCHNIEREVFSMPFSLGNSDASSTGSE